MGEEGETIEFYSGNCTIVFWNLDDYPVPNDTDLSAKSPIRSNIELALRQMGFHGYARINLLGEQRKYDSGVKTRTGRLVYLPKGTPAYNAYNTVDMTYYILLELENTVQEHFNAAVLAKPTAELRRILGCMKSRGHNVVLMEPPPYAECFFSVDSLVDNARLLDGGMPRTKKALTLEDLREDESDPRSYINEEEDDSHPSTEMVDFSVRTKHVKGDRTVIFWDAVDCPFPPLCFSSSPDDIYEKIKLAVLERDFIGKISIWAYVEKDSEFLKREKTWASKIYFLPGENEAASRRIRMFNDVQLLSRDSPVRPTDDVSLILVSDQFMGDDSYMKEFLKMRYRDYYLAMVVPSKQSEESEQPENHNQWPGLLMDGAYHWRPCPLTRG